MQTGKVFGAQHGDWVMVNISGLAFEKDYRLGRLMIEEGVPTVDVDLGDRVVTKVPGEVRPLTLGEQITPSVRFPDETYETYEVEISLRDIFLTAAVIAERTRRPAFIAMNRAICGASGHNARFVPKNFGKLSDLACVTVCTYLGLKPSDYAAFGAGNALHNATDHYTPEGTAALLRNVADLGDY